MAYTSIPANPAYKARWDGWANTLADNVRELIVDVPAMKTAATALTTRVSQAETQINGVAASLSGATSTANLALTTAQNAATSAGTAQTAATAAQTAAQTAATDAQTAAGQVSGLSTTVTGNTSAITALQSGKADKTALATVATTGRYADLIGAPSGGSTGVVTTDGLPSGAVLFTRSTTTRPTARTDIMVRWYTAAQPSTAAGWIEGLDEWVPTTAPAPPATQVTDFSTGTAWPSPWTIARTPSGGGATIASGRGRLTTGAAGNYDGADSVAARYGGQVADSDVTFLFRLVSQYPYPRVVFRSPQADLDAASGVVVLIEKTRMYAQTVASYTGTTVGNVDKTHTVGTDYRCRIRLVGTTIQARSWPAANAEPTSWEITATVPAGTGHQGLVVGPGAPAAAQVVDFDDITYATNPS